MTRFGKTLSTTLLATSVLVAPVTTSAWAQDTMWFADAQTTAYYNLDQPRHELVARFEKGPKGGNPIVVRRTLDAGAVEQIAADGTDTNTIRATLIVSREGDTLRARVKTEQLQQQHAGHFQLPAVVGLFYGDARIATNPAEVRRQGGFATAGAVQWLPAAPKEDVAGRFYLPAVVGMAFSDPSIATNPEEVRRQGGFATAGAVQWLPSAPATGEAKAETVELGAL